MAGSDELRANNAQLEQNNRLMEKLVDLLGKLTSPQGQTGLVAAGAGAPGGGFNPGATSQGGGGTSASALTSGSFWSGKTSDAMGPMQSFLASAGSNGAAALAGGLSGGPAALAAAGAQIAGQIAKDALAPTFAKEDTYIESLKNGSPYQDSDFLTQRAKLEGKVSGILAEDNATMRMAARSMGFMTGTGSLEERSRRAADWELGYRENVASAARTARGELDKFVSVSSDAARRTEAFFSPFVDMGKRPGNADIDAIAKIAIKQADAHYALHADVEAAVSRITVGKNTGGLANKQ